MLWRLCANSRVRRTPARPQSAKPRFNPPRAHRAENSSRQGRPARCPASRLGARGDVGCKRCSSSVSCVGWVYVCALSLCCCVFFSRFLRSMGQEKYHHRANRQYSRPTAGVKPGSEQELWYRASSYARFVEVLQ